MLLEVDRLLNWWKQNLSSDYEVVSYYSIIEQLASKVLNRNVDSEVQAYYNSQAPHKGVLTAQSSSYLALSGSTTLTFPYNLQIQTSIETTGVESDLKTLITANNRLIHEDYSVDVTWYDQVDSKGKPILIRKERVNNATGTFDTSADYSRTNYIAVSASTKYKVVRHDTTFDYAWYTSGNVFISGGQLTADGVITSPATATYLVFSVVTSEFDYSDFILKGASGYRFQMVYNQPVISQIADGETNTMFKIINIDGSVAITDTQAFSDDFTYKVRANSTNYDVKGVLSNTIKLSVEGEEYQSQIKAQTKIKKLQNTCTITLSVDDNDTVHSGLEKLTRDTTSYSTWGEPQAFYIYKKGVLDTTWTNPKVIDIVQQTNNSGFNILQVVIASG